MMSLIPDDDDLMMSAVLTATSVLINNIGLGLIKAKHSLMPSGSGGTLPLRPQNPPPGVVAVHT